MNIEVPADQNIEEIITTFETGFKLRLKNEFVKEVFEELMSSQGITVMNETKMEEIVSLRLVLTLMNYQKVSRLFDILSVERIENLIDLESQQSAVIRIYLEETESGYLVDNSIFKILTALNISEVKEHSKKNTNNGCLKFTLSNGKDQLFGVEEGKLLGVPEELIQLDGGLIYIMKDTSIRRGIFLLNDLNSFIFKTMEDFKAGLANLLQRIDRYNEEVERKNQLELQRQAARAKQTQNQTQNRSQTQSTQVSRAPMAVQRSQAQFDDEDEENKMNYENSNALIQESRQTAVRAVNGVDYQSNGEWFDEEFEDNRPQARPNLQQQQQQQQHQQQQLQQQQQYQQQQQIRQQQQQHQQQQQQQNRQQNQHQQQQQQQQQKGEAFTAEECNELLSLLYDDD